MITTTAYTIRYDATQEVYPFDVVGPDGEIYDSFATQAEALRDAYERTDADEADRVRGLIEDRLDTLDLAALKAAAAYLGL